MRTLDSMGRVIYSHVKVTTCLPLSIAFGFDVKQESIQIYSQGKRKTMNFSSFLNIVDGKETPTQAARYGINPANKENLWPAPVSTLDDVHAAVDSARRAAPAWAATPWSDRQGCVSKLADALAGHAQGFAKLLTLEQGKPVGNVGIKASEI